MLQKIDVEQINFLELPSMLLAEKKSFPSIPCIYFVLNSGSQVVYIGKAENLRNRWVKQKHHKSEKIQAMQGLSVACLTTKTITLHLQARSQTEARKLNSTLPALQKSVGMQILFS